MQKEAGHETVSEPMNDIAEEFNMPNTMNYRALTFEDTTAKVDAHGNHRMELKYSMSDGRTVILEIYRERNSLEHVFKEENGKRIEMSLEEIESAEEKGQEQNSSQRPAGGRDRAEEAYEARFME